MLMLPCKLCDLVNLGSRDVLGVDATHPFALAMYL